MADTADAPSMASTMVEYAIDTDVVGGRVVVDGVDVSSRVHAVQLVAGAREPTILALELKPGATGTIGGQALLDLVPAKADDDLVETIARMVESLVPAEVEQAALNDPELTNEPGAVAASVLRHVARLLRGEG